MKFLRLSQTVVCAALSGLFFSSIAFAGTAKIKEFQVIHSEATLKKGSYYAVLNKLSDADLKKTVTSPAKNDYITVKKGTKILYNGNTRVYLLMQRGYGDMVVTYDEFENSEKYYDE